MSLVKDYILEQVSQRNLSPDRAMTILQELGELEKGRAQDNRIAVIGMSCNLSNAVNYEEFWQNLLHERDCLGYMPRELDDYYRLVENKIFADVMGMKPFGIEENRFNSRSSYMKNTDKFDAAFFGIAPREAKFMEPGQRIFLETACAAIEDGGYSLNDVMGSSIGVFVGKDHNNSEFYKRVTMDDTLSTTGSWHGILASRISYIFNFRGPAIVIDTACSSGLVCVHEACRSLQAGDCDMAIAGGIACGGSPADGNKDPDEAVDALESVASHDSIVRPFDKKSAGTVFGEGCAALLLKPLKKAIADGDRIHAVILASATNNDGASNGITAPNPAAQTDVITKAWDTAKIDPRTISYIETHGTGTLLGDPIEFKALNNAFRKYSRDRQFCGIGSAKSNVGHLIGASGPVGMMKVILAMKNKTIPASINFEEPNPHISFMDSAMYIVDRATPWGRDGEPLRAGISSFGFSGTNVHVLLESADAYMAPKAEQTERPRVLTISAKTKWSLEQYISRYTDLIDRDPAIDLDALCYTASMGRGHYSFRLAIPFRSYEDLSAKLHRLNYSGLDHVDRDVYYGSYKVVSDKRMERGPGEYTESEVRGTNRRAEDALGKLHAIGINMQDIHELCDCYIHGATVRWEALFEGKRPQKLHLPTYPFERTTYWAEERVLKTKDVSEFGEANDHPLVERCLLRSIQQDIYITRFSVKKHWILQDHIIMGRNIIPGTAYVELAREVCSKYIDGEIELRDLIFMTPLAVDPKEEVEAQIVVTKHRGYVEFAVATAKTAVDAEGSEWIKHVEGKAYPLDPESCPAPFDLSVLETDPTLMSKPVQLAGLDTPDAIMCFGPRWQNIERVYISPRDLYVHARIDDRFVDDLKTFRFHTSMLDATVNAGIQATMEGVYLPFLFKSLKLYRPLPQEVYSRAICKNPNAPGDETYTYDVQLMDKDGNILVDITDYTVKKVHKFNNYEDKSYYRVKWHRKDREETYEGSLGTTLIIGSQTLSDEFVDRIEAASTRLILADNGSSFAEIDRDIYDVDCSEEGYRSLFAALQGTQIDTILYAGAYGPRNGEASLQTFENTLDRGVYGLFHMTKALIKERVHGKLDIVILTDHGAKVTGREPMVKPENAALMGLAKCVVQEYENLVTRSVDTDSITDMGEIMKELLSTERCSRVALRGGERYVEQLVKFDRDAQMDEIPMDLSQGCILITGGIGGLGLEAAKYLAEKGAKNIVLQSRRSFPKEDQWAAIMEEQADPKLCNAITILSELRNKGIGVLTVSADVSDPAVMDRLLRSMEKAFGKIVGVVHCAGVAGDGFLINKPFRVFRDVIVPKVVGTKILDSLLRWEDMQLFVAYSSMTTLLGGPGQGDYTAANSYLDAYAQHGALMGKPVVSVNWPAWSETGMAVDYEVSDAQVLFQSLNTATAISYLNDAVSYGLINVVPGELNYGVMAQIADVIPLDLAPNIRKAVEVQKRRMASGEGDRGRSFNIQDVVILGKSAADLTHTEKQVAYIYAAVLSIEEIDIYENYNSLGGNSMTSTEILKILNQHFDNMLDVSDVFSYPTVFEMAEYIDSKLNADGQEKESGEPVTQLIDQLETGEIEIDKMIEYFEE